MQSLSGVPISPGYAEGNAVIPNVSVTSDIARFPIDLTDVEGEFARFRTALKRSCDELDVLEQRVLTELGPTQSSIFSAHLALLRDRRIIDQVKRRIREDLVNVEQALDREITDLARVLASVENEYMRERVQDLRDVGRRVLRQLARDDSSGVTSLLSPSVIVARELLPSDTIDLDRQHVVAIVTEEGGQNSHMAILARALGIPAVTAVVGACARIAPGSRLLVDGRAGRVTLLPTASAVKAFHGLKRRYQRYVAAEAQAEQLDCITLDGTAVSLSANINRSDEAALVSRHHLDGVGLFRTEFMYLDASIPPSYERQLEDYRQLIKALEGYPIVIRTLDFGGDKLPAFMSRCGGANPNTGLRGLRFSLAQPELFARQLQAIVMAARGHDVRVMFPMVLGQKDLRLGIEQLQLAAKAVGVSGKLPVGAMIETPSAIFALPEILDRVDFVSIGTNDLTQFMLAADRNKTELPDTHSVLHPSVLRAILHIVQVCGAAGRELCVCGEAAGDTDIACLLVGLGVRNLSMSPVRAASVRFRLRSARLSELEQLAGKALAAESSLEVAQLLLEAMAALEQADCGRG